MSDLIRRRLRQADLAGQQPVVPRFRQKLSPRKHPALQGRAPSGRRNRTAPSTAARALAVSASLRSAALRHAAGGRTETAPSKRKPVTAQDVRYFLETGDLGDLVIFLVDSSDSMTVGRQLAAAGRTVAKILSHSTRVRSRAAILTFRGKSARVILPPTSSAVRASRLLRRIPGGGPTPLSAALVKSVDLMEQERRRSPFRRAFVVLLSDGEGNVRLPGIYSEREELVYLRRLLELHQVTLLCVDTADLKPRSGPPDITPAQRLARNLGGEYVSTGRPEIDLLSVRWRPGL